MSAPLTGRVALVTGSTRGIGRAIARRLAEQGASVVVHGRAQRAAAEAVAREIAARGGKAAVVMGDLATAEGPAAVVRDAFAALGSLDILVNNAGVFEGRELATLTLEQVDRVLAINVRAVIVASREFAARLPASHPAGRIINVSSIAGSVPAGRGSLYAASKAAVNSLTRSHATELGPRGITVNAIAPGVTETEMAGATFPPQGIRAIVNGTALGRLGQPDDIAGLAAFLCSDDAAWVTGQVIGVDGGMVTGGMNLIRAAGGV